MENDLIVTVDHVSMRFNLSSEKFDSFKEYVIKSIKRQVSYDEFWERLYPKSAPFKKTFSFAVRSMSNPAPSSIRGAILPLTDTVPFVGFNTPAMIFSMVLFPLPLSPTSPRDSPRLF